MTILTAPTLHYRLLQTVGEAVVNDKIEETIRLGVGVVHELRESVARIRRQFEHDLAEGIESRSFTSSHGPTLVAVKGHEDQLGQLLKTLAGSEGTAAESFIAELRLLKKETDDFRERLASALALALQPPVRLNCDRLKGEADADFAAGRSVTFETPEDMLKGLGGCD
jgi:hypothetical protein